MYNDPRIYAFMRKVLHVSKYETVNIAVIYFSRFRFRFNVPFYLSSIRVLSLITLRFSDLRAFQMKLD